MRLPIDDIEEVEEIEEPVEIIDYTFGSSNVSFYPIEEDEVEGEEEEEELDFWAISEISVSNDAVLKDLPDFFSQSRASPRTPPVTPRTTFFLGGEQHPYQQSQQHQQQPIMDFAIHDLIESLPYSADYELFPTLTSNGSS